MAPTIAAYGSSILVPLFGLEGRPQLARVTIDEQTPPDVGALSGDNLDAAEAGTTIALTRALTK